MKSFLFINSSKISVCITIYLSIAIAYILYVTNSCPIIDIGFSNTAVNTALYVLIYILAFIVTSEIYNMCLEWASIFNIRYCIERTITWSFILIPLMTMGVVFLMNISI